MSRKTFQNLRSDVGRALALFSPPQGHIRNSELDARWRDLRALLPAGELRYRLSRLISYCSDRAIAPEAVDDDVVPAFKSFLAEATTVRRPEGLWRAILRAWNDAVVTIPDWPGHRLTVPRARESYCLPWHAFQPELVAEIEAWLARRAAPDPFDLDAPNPARPDSIKSYRFTLLQYVSVLAQLGHRPSELTCLADLIRPDRVKLVLRWFWDRAEGKASSTTAAIGAQMLAIARYCVKAPDDVIKELRRLHRFATPKQQGMRTRNKELLRQFDSEHNKGKLVCFPVAIARELARCKRPTLEQARLMQAAAAVEILLMMPMRRKNLCALRLDRHFRYYRDRGRVRVFIVIPGDEVKNGEPIEIELPAETADLIETYIDRFQPLLSATPGTWLFPGDRPDRPKDPNALGRLVARSVKKRTGLVVRLHLFRHIAGKFFLDRHPGQYEVMRQLLAHRDIRTTVANYTGMEVAAAVRHYDQAILQIRKAHIGGLDG